MKPVLSKTGYQKGLQCKKALYLYKYHSKLRDPISPERLARFNSGHEIGFLARKLFPGGIDLNAGKVNRPVIDHKDTLRAIAEGYNVLYEPAFIYQGVIVYNDILVRRPNGWDLYEVKSNQRIPDHYVSDLALQAYIVEGNQLPLLSCSIIHLRKPLSEISEQEIADEIFTITDYTDACKNAYPAIKENIQNMQYLLTTRRVPEIATGDHCHRPYPCEFFGYCSRPVKHADTGLFTNLNQP
jgi:hypothetical protein